MTTTTIETDVDAKPATVVQHDRSNQLALDGLLPSVDELLLQLVAANDDLRKATELVSEAKDTQKGVERRREFVVAQLAQRGLNLRDKRISFDLKPGQFAIDRETGEFVTATATATAPERGAYERIPQEAAPEFCICGSLMSASAADHDRAHAETVSVLIAEIAPAAAGAPRAIGGIHAPGQPCREAACQKIIAFAISPNLKELPVDVVPTEDGDYVVDGEIEFEGKPRVQLAKAKAHPDVTQRYTSHYKTCENPHRFSKNGGAKK